MKNKLKLIILGVFVIRGLYAQEFFDVGLYSFNFNQKIKTSGTKVYLLEDKRVYVELQDFLKIIGITNNKWIDEKFTIDVENIYNQEKVINLEKKYVTSKQKRVFFKNEVIEKGEKIYVDINFISNLLEIKEIERDDDKLTININTSFRLPVELSNIRKYRRKELREKKKEEQEQVFSPKKFFQLGNLRTLYSYNKNFQSSNYESKMVDIEYLGPLLYGEFKTYYKIHPKVKNYQTSLTYRNIYTNHAIIFGDTSVNLPTVLGGTVGRLRGISFKKDEKLIGEYNNNKVTITGSAPLGKFVELYQNGNLISYEDVREGEYSFEDMPLNFISDSFYVIIYNLDGTILKEKLSRYYGGELEKPGEFGFRFQIGESSYDKYNQFIGEIDYGLNENLTLKTGFYDLKYNTFYNYKDNPQEEKTAKIGLLYASDYSKNPYNLELNGFRNGGDTDYTYKYNQIFKDYTIAIQGGDYSKSAQKRINKKYEVGFNVNKSRFIKDNITLGLNYYSTKNLYEQETNEIGSILRLGFQNFTPEYGYYKDLIKGTAYHDFSVRSYYFRNYLIFAGVSHRAMNDFNETRYRIEVMNRQRAYNGVRYKAYYEKSDKYGDIFGASFEIDYDTWFSGRAEYTKENGVSHISSGFKLDKIFNLSDFSMKTTRIESSIVKGIVYVDTNNNGIYDIGVDRPLPRTTVKVSSKSTVTDEKGRYSIGNLVSDLEHELKIYSQNPLYKGRIDGYKLRLNPGSSMSLDIPVYTRKIVSGMINFSNEKLMNKYLKTLYLSVIDKKTRKTLEISIPENDGFYMMENLIAGEYLITLESVENPGEILLEKELKVTPDLKEVNMNLNVEGDESEKSKKLAFNAIVIGRN